MAQKKSKERREEPLGTMSYQTSSKRSPPFCLLIGARKTQVFWHQSEERTAATVWNWSGKTLSPGALLAVLFFSSCLIFPPVWTFPCPHYLPLGLRGCHQHGCSLEVVRTNVLAAQIIRIFIQTSQLVRWSMELERSHKQVFNTGYFLQEVHSTEKVMPN